MCKIIRSRRSLYVGEVFTEILVIVETGQQIFSSENELIFVNAIRREIVAITVASTETDRNQIMSNSSFLNYGRSHRAEH